MTLSEFLKKYMDKADMNQAELSKKTGIPASTISSLLGRNNNTVDIEKLLSMCRALDCDLEEYINSLEGNETFFMPSGFVQKYGALDHHGKLAVNCILDAEYQRCSNTVSMTRKTVRLNHAVLPASAGTGMYALVNDMEMREDPDCPEARADDFVVTVRGDSMSPNYCDGDEVYVKKQDDIDEGEIGVFYVDGNTYIKKKGRDRLISINDAYCDVFPAEICKCFGKVIGRVQGV